MTKVIKLIKSKALAIGLASMAMFAFSFNFTFAAPSSTPEELIDSFFGGIINTCTDLALYVIDNYLAYIVALGIIISGYYLFKRFGRVGSR